MLKSVRHREKKITQAKLFNSLSSLIMKDVTNKDSPLKSQDF